MADNNRRICGFRDCPYDGKYVDLDSADYIVVNRRFYHKKCYEDMKAQQEKIEKDKLNVQRIKNIWLDKINPNVAISFLYKEVNALIRDKHIPSEYVLFVVEYCAEHKSGLHYPAGIKFFIDKPYIRDAYARKNIVKVKPETFTVNHDDENAPKFKTPPTKKQGFGSILGE